MNPHPTSSSPYSPPKETDMPTPTRRKRSFRIFKESSNLLRTRGYLIPLPTAVNPIPELLLEKKSPFPDNAPSTPQRPHSFFKMLHRKAKPQHVVRLPSIDPPPTSNNAAPDEVVLTLSTPPTTATVTHAPMVVVPPAMTASIPLDLFYTSEFRAALSPKVNLSGWAVHDADLAMLVQLHQTSPPTQHLVHLYLNECINFTDDGMKSLGSIPSLRTLHCKQCPQLQGHGLFALAHTLSELDVSGCLWIHDAAVALIARSFSRLQSLSIAHCVNVTNQGLFALADRPHHSAPLLKIDVSGCVKLTDSGLLVLLTHCPKLEYVHATHLPSLEGLTFYACLPQQRLLPSVLTHVDLSHNKALHFSALPTLARGCGRKLTHLTLTHTHGIDDDGLVALGRACPNLVSLVLSGCYAITDYGLVRLVQHVPVANENDVEFDATNTRRCTQLRTLDLTGCFHVTTTAVVAVASQCLYLTHIWLHGLPRLEQPAFHELATRCRYLTDIGCGGLLIQSSEKNFFAAPKLIARSLLHLLVESTATAIHINKCACDAADLAAALTYAPSSRAFRDLQFGSLATDAVCQALRHVGAHLRVLNLSRSRQFTTASLQLVLRATPQLRTLDVQHCDQLTNDWLFDLVRCCASLEHLNMAGNVAMTDAGVKCFVPDTACRRLMSLNVKGVPQVSKACVAAIAASHPQTQICASGLEPKPYDLGVFLARGKWIRQAACKVVAWMQLCLKRYRDKELRRRLMWTRLKFRHQCARRIQRLIREVQEAKREVERQIQAAKDLAEARARGACIIQRNFRTYLFLQLIHREVAAKRAADAFDAAVKRRNLENAAASAIENAYRYYRGRHVTLKWHGWLANFLNCRDRSARAIQRIYRGHRGRRDAAVVLDAQQTILFDHILLEHTRLLAQMYIARLVRGFLGRRAAAKRLAYVLDVARIRDASARVLQRAFRAYFSKIAFQRLLFSNAARIQCRVRGWFGRADAAQYILSTCYASPIVLCLLTSRSIYQLTLAQPWQTKRNAATRWATSMQSAWRGYLGRVRAHTQRAHKLHRMYVEDVAARRLQRFFAHIRRMRHLARVRAEVARRNACATTIQATWRMWLGKVKAYAVFLGRQRRLQHHVIRSMYYQAHVNPASSAWAQWRLVHEGAAHVLVRFYKQSLRARGWLSPSEIRHRMQKATHIQAWIRGFLWRRWTRQYAAAMHAAAHCVQRGWHRKVEWKKWRAVVEGMREKKRLQDEEDRASGIAKTRMKQFANDMLERQLASAIVLQRTYRTRKQRHVYKKSTDARIDAWKAEGGAKLDAHMAKGMQHEVWQAQVWTDTMAKPVKVSQELVIEADKDLGYNDIVAKTTELMQLNLDEEIELLEDELRDLTDECQKEYATYEALAAEESEIHAYVKYFEQVRVSPKLKRERESALASLAPFATQGKRLIIDTSRLANENQRLKYEIIRLEKMRRAFWTFASDRLSFDPLLYELDVTRMLAALEPEWQPNSQHLYDTVLAIVPPKEKAPEASPE
ncbi:Aste57867_21793 [Aphanomyces stellatus]|uniref:Aste57867_21793 protein n=1 Tax=Aphanomyces stellatus TaxID=120398 RepID=A0A485LIG7_9STRA|nr:hypothetical protein As57867_021724 [Aphanomyces stellatus]VFT98462.1 Aste57867_21793 [Aphanomyces stellatus]